MDNTRGSAHGGKHGGNAGGKAFQAGALNARYRGGRFVNEWGYVRLSTGRTSAKYEHRAVVERLLFEQALQANIAWALTEEYLETGEEYVGIDRSACIAANVAANLAIDPPVIAANVHVHHVDGNRQHNCPCNLMLLDRPIHYAVTQAARRMAKLRDIDDMMSKLRAAGGAKRTDDL